MTVNQSVPVGAAASFPAVSDGAPAAALIPRLDRVRETAPGQWIACCPAHADRSPSLSVKECNDGTLLLKCFTGCSAADIVAAVGLELRDLFPPRNHHSPPKSLFERRRHGQALDALRALSRESLVVLVAAENLASGMSLSAEDLERLQLAAQRIRDAREVAV